jgi:hypothetical protein
MAVLQAAQSETEAGVETGDTTHLKRAQLLLAMAVAVLESATGV